MNRFLAVTERPSSAHERAIVVETLHDDVRLPRRATAGSAGHDLFAYLRGRTVRCSDGTRQWELAAGADGVIELAPGLMALVPLGFKARLPAGHEAQIRPRSGAAFKHALEIPNAPGTIDADYPEEWMVMVRNAGTAHLRLAHGDRIAQMVLQRFEVLPFVPGRVSVSTDRAGGFGSTGR